MDIDNIRLYDKKLGIDGTIAELIDWAYRYDRDYSDEALLKIADEAAVYDKEKARIPRLVVKDRQRKAKNDGSLPLEQLRLDKLVYGKILGCSELKDYGEVEIFEDRGKVVISIIGMDDIGCFTAAGVLPIEEFMADENDDRFPAAEDDWLESLVGEILFYNKQYDKKEVTK